METIFDFKKKIILQKLENQWILLSNKQNAILTLNSEDYYFLKKTLSKKLKKNEHLTFRNIPVFEF